MAGEVGQGDRGSYLRAGRQQQRAQHGALPASAANNGVRFHSIRAGPVHRVDGGAHPRQLPRQQLPQHLRRMRRQSDRPMNSRLAALHSCQVVSACCQYIALLASRLSPPQHAPAQRRTRRWRRWPARQPALRGPATQGCWPPQWSPWPAAAQPGSWTAQSRPGRKGQGLF